MRSSGGGNRLGAPLVWIPLVAAAALALVLGLHRTAPAGPPFQEPTMSHQTRGPGHPPGGDAPNRLAGESSPYLLLHKDNPVDWYPWGEEALERARREGKPIFLSVGYSTCYWCHVMERESFSDPETAALMNRWFVSVKVDREERPDLDEIYMTATQLLTRQGGWPNSVFLTPSLEPFYAGTYFPPEDRYGRPGFRTVLAGLADAWRTRRGEVETEAHRIAAGMRQYLEERAEPGDAPPPPQVARRALAGLESSFDRQWGGFGGAPKFPTPSNLYLLLELAGDEETAAAMLATTLDRMARGGVYDQLAGGFHRYSTDARWLVPHFEKMLYDNAQLLEVYARWHGATGDAEAARVARETAAFLEREMTSPEGALWSAIDAETGGHEGAYYVWTGAELERLLGPDDFALAAPVWGFDGPPSFEGEAYVLHLPEPLDRRAAALGIGREALLERLAGPRAKLLAARAERQRPLTDDKVLADWNGMAITGLATAGRVLGDRRLVDRAARAAAFVLDRLWVAEAGGGRRLHHSWREGRASVPAFLADYVFLVRGLLALDEADDDPRWLAAAEALTAEQVERLRAPAGGFFAAAARDDLLFRTQEVFDGAVPAANAAAALDLIELARRTGAARWRREAEATLAAYAPTVERFPDGGRMMALAARRWAEAFGPEGQKKKAEELGGAKEGEPGEAAEGGGVAAAGAPPGTIAAAASGKGSDARERGTEAGSPTQTLVAEARQAVRVRASFDEPGEDGWRRFTVHLAIAEGWHVNANPASQQFLIPTAVEAAGAGLEGVRYPEPRLIRPSYAEEDLAVYEGAVEITGRVRPEDPAARLRVTYQPCDAERCLPPVTEELAVEP
jgi:uncharacterized protein YyaL (SSP411 family)